MNNDLDKFPGRDHSEARSEKIAQYILYITLMLSFLYHSYSLLNGRESEIYTL